MDEVHLFLDTMVFLHYKPLSDIDWCALVSSARVRLVVARSVIRELDKHKTEHRSARIRDRAKRSLRTIEAAVANGPDAQLRPSVSMVISQDAPNPDFAALGLSPDWPDDMHIASAIEFGTAHRDIRVVFVTADVGARIKARQLNLDVLVLPDETRLPDDPDPLESEVLALKRRLAEASVPTLPELKLMFFDGVNHLRCRVKAGSGSPSMELEMKRVRTKYSPLAISKSNAGMLSILGHSEQSIARYNNMLTEYYSKYKEYLVQMENIHEVMRRTFAIGPGVANEGRAPAEDIDIHMLFPSTVVLLTSNALEEDPDMPEPPASPFTADHLVGGLWSPDNLRVEGGMELLSGLYQRRVPKRNVNGPWTTRYEPSAVSWHVGKLKHHDDVTLDAIHVRFETCASHKPRPRWFCCG